MVGAWQNKKLKKGIILDLRQNFLGIWNSTIDHSETLDMQAKQSNTYSATNQSQRILL